MLFCVRSLQDTQTLAAALGKAIQKGCFIALRGSLGAGKTSFVQGLAKGLSAVGAVTSPTFTLMHAYEGGRLPLYHFDLYRIDEDECYALGFDEYFFNENVVCAVEWSERLSQLPDHLIIVDMQIIEENKRTIHISAESAVLAEGWEPIEYTCT